MARPTFRHYTTLNSVLRNLSFDLSISSPAFSDPPNSSPIRSVISGSCIFSAPVRDRDKNDVNLTMMGRSDERSMQQPERLLFTCFFDILFSLHRSLDVLFVYARLNHIVMMSFTCKNSMNGGGPVDNTYSKDIIDVIVRSSSRSPSVETTLSLQ